MSNNVILTFEDATLPVLQAVLVECSKQRENVRVNLANGPAFAPQVHCGGSNEDGMLYAITTPRLPLAAALAVLAAADLVHLHATGALA